MGANDLSESRRGKAHRADWIMEKESIKVIFQGYRSVLRSYYHYCGMQIILSPDVVRRRMTILKKDEE